MQIHINRRQEFVIKIMIYLLVCMICAFVCTYIIKINLIKIITLLAIVPIVFLPYLKKKATKKMDVFFEVDYFITKIDDKHQSERKVFLKDIQYYSIQFPNDNFSSIKFIFRDHSSLEYSFFQKNKYEGDMESNELINAFHSFFKVYNSSSSNFEKIVFKPSFYATNTGLFVIISLALFLISGLLVYVNYSKKTFPLTFLLSFFLIIHLLVKRNNDLKYFTNTSERLL